MRIVAAIVLSLLILPAPAKAQEPTLEFSAPPADAPDFLSWDLDRELERTLTPASAGADLALMFFRTGLCREGERSCPVRLRLEMYAKFRCIAQNDQEFDCRRRLAWKSRTLIDLVVRYVMTRDEVRTEGFAMEAKDEETQFFVRTTTPEPGWRAVNPEGEAREWVAQEVLFTSLLTLPREP